MIVRVLVVDDHEIARMGVRLLLSDKRQWDICGEAKDGAEAIDKVVQLSPDVVILDLNMPGMNGFETAVQIRRVAPSTRIVMYSVHEIPTTARLVGADAFVSKSSVAEDLVSTISHVLELDRDGPRA
jgi:DNA-binding NarL/FixJ family response regulator